LNFVLPSHIVGKDPSLRKPEWCVHSRGGKTCLWNTWQGKGVS